MASPPSLLTTAQAAEQLGVSPRTVARWAASGELPVAQRLPGETGALLFDPRVVRGFADERREKAVAAS